MLVRFYKNKDDKLTESWPVTKWPEPQEMWVQVELKTLRLRPLLEEDEVLLELFLDLLSLAFEKDHFYHYDHSTQIWSPLLLWHTYYKINSILKSIPWVICI